MSDEQTGWLHIHESVGPLGSLGEAGRSIAFAPNEDDQLAQGTIGTVYQLLDPDDPDGPLHVVKVFSANDPDLREEFEGEYAVISDIRARLIDPVAVPPMARATLGDDGQPALVMPYYDEMLLLSRHARQLIHQGDWLAIETLVLNTMIAFTEAMIALRDTNRTCVDRKAKDFYWDGEHLTVLDWNLVGGITPAACATELQLLASVWYEVLTGTYATLRLDPMDDSMWQHRRVESVEGGVISVGLRIVMEAAQQLPIEQRFANLNGLPDYALVLPHLQRWLELVSNGLETLSRGAVADFVAGLPEPMQNTELALLIYTDLAWRLGNDGLAATRASMMGLTPDVEVTVTGDQALIEAIRGYDITQAQAMAREQLYNATDQQRYREAAHKTRWVLLLNVMAATRRAGTVGDSVRRSLVEVATTLLHDPADDRADKLNTAEKVLGKVKEDIDRLRDEARYSAALETLDRVMEEVLLRRDALYLRRQERVETQISNIDALLQHAERVGYLASAEEPPTETLLHAIVPHFDVLGHFNALLNDGTITLQDDTLQNLLTLSPDLARFDDDLAFEWRIKDYREYARYRLRFMPPTPQPEALLDALMTGQGLIETVPASMRVSLQNVVEANVKAAATLLVEQTAPRTRAAYESMVPLANYMTTQRMFLSNIFGNNRWQRLVAPYLDRLDQATNFYQRWDALLIGNTLRLAIINRHEAAVLLGDVLRLMDEFAPYQDDEGEWQVIVDLRELMDGAESGQTAADWHNFVTDLIEKTQAQRDAMEHISADLEARREVMGEVEAMVAALNQTIVEADTKFDELTDERKTLGGLILQMSERLNGTDGEIGLLQQLREAETGIETVKERINAYPDPEKPSVDETTLALVDERLAALQAQLSATQAAVNAQAWNAFSLRLERLEGEVSFSDPAVYAEEIGELHERLLQVAPDAYPADTQERLETLLKRWRGSLRTSLSAYPGLRRNDIEDFMVDYDNRVDALLGASHDLLGG